MKTSLLLGPVLCLAMAPLPALAAAEPLTLPLAIQKALAEHPRVRAAEAHVEAARAAQVQASAYPNPSFTLQAGEMPVTSPLSGNLMAGVTLPLVPGGLRAARAEVSRLEMAIAESELLLQRQELACQVKVAYFRAQHEEQRVRLAQAAVADALRLLTASRKRFEAGDVPRLEVYRAEVEHSRAQRDVVVTESGRSLARGRLQAILHRPADQPLVLVDVLPATRSPLPALAELQARMLETSPRLRRAEWQLQQEERQRDLARAHLWSGAEWGVAAGSADGRAALSTTVSLPLPLYRPQGEIAAAEARIRAAEARREAECGEVLLELEEAHGEAAIALARYRLLHDSELPQAARFAENARKRYLAGEGSGLEAVEALRVLRETEAEHQQALLSYREALARLERAAGLELPQ